MHSSRFRYRLLIAIAGLASLAGTLEAKHKTKSVSEPKDEISVVGHVPLTGEPVRRLILTQHFSTYYLYAEREAGKSVTLLDVTQTARPLAISNVAYTADGQSSMMLSATGTAALVTDEPATRSQPSPPQSVRIMDFSDALHPKIAREFNGVTAIGRDDRRGLIFIANPDGIWILHQQFAEDPEVKKAYDDYVTYTR